MKVSNKEKNLIFILVGILALVAVYYLIAEPMGEKTGALKISNGTLQDKLTRLETLEANKVQYKEDMAEFLTENEDIMNKFNPALKFEDYLLLIKELEEKEEVFMTRGTIYSGIIEDITYPAVSGVDTNIVTSQNVEIIITDSEGKESAYSNPAGIFLMNQVLDLEFNTSYDDMKEFVTYILENEDVMEFESIALDYDATTGELTGTSTINTFSLIGNNKEYKAPVINGVSTGVKNLFGTYTAPVVTE